MPWNAPAEVKRVGPVMQDGGKGGPMGVGAGSTKLFVGCLPYSTTEADLEPIFSQFGPVAEVVILKDGSGSSKGAGFVKYQDEPSAITAISYLQGHVLEGATRGINISFATSGARGNPQQAFGQPGMQQNAANGGAGAPGCKIFVGQLPYSRTEDDLHQLFGSVGPVVEVIMLKDKQTQEKKGAAFVKFATPQHAAVATSMLNGFTFTGSTRPISVSIAQSEMGQGAAGMGTFAPGAAAGVGGAGQKRPFAAAKGGVPSAAPPTQGSSEPSEPGSKLFVGQLPFSKTEEDISEVFSQYGTVVEVLIHRDAQGQKKGGAFVRFQTASSAAAALEMEGYVFPGSPRAITVSIAGGEGAKRRRGP